VPAISILLPVRNAGPYLAASLRSLERQTFGAFEIIAVDDGSTDGSGAALDRVARREPRLRVVHTAPLGLPAALNRGLTEARGALIARHDADDLSHRTRLERQITFLGAHPEVGVLGTRVRLFPSEAAGDGMRRWARWHNALLTHDAMAADALIDSPLCHGTAMIRRTALRHVGGWAERGWPEDVDLWQRLLAAGIRFAKLPAALYAWRQHSGSATRRDPRYRRERFDALRMAALARGVLARRSEVVVIGVGTSLARWTDLLRRDGRTVYALAAGRPAAAPHPSLRPPIVLVFGAAAARARWRAALRATGYLELRDFVFVS
jgi:glycosyltransferase involved in cell wall biosynthesis